MTVTPGGAGGNTAAWLAGHDVDVSLVARVGADEAGRTAVAELSAVGIDCRFAIDPELATCCVVVLVAPDGDRTMLADRGANSAFCVDDVDLPQPGRPRASAPVGLCAARRPVPTGRAGRARAGQSGRLDHLGRSAGRRAHWHGRCGPNFLSWVDGVDLLLPNDSELAALGGLDPAMTAATAVVVTHGRHGASWYAADARVNVPAPQTCETDSTGAGDAFNAGLLAAWLAARNPLAALQSGVAAGTAAAARIGARPGAALHPV